MDTNTLMQITWLPLVAYFVIDMSYMFIKAMYHRIQEYKRSKSIAVTVAKVDTKQECVVGEWINKGVNNE